MAESGDTIQCGNDVTTLHSKLTICFVLLQQPVSNCQLWMTPATVDKLAVLRLRHGHRPVDGLTAWLAALAEQALRRVVGVRRIFSTSA